MKNILFVGGTGLQGRLTLQLLQERQSQANFYISSRKKGSETILVDVSIPETFQNILAKQIDLVVLCTIDSENSLLHFCIDHGLDFLDITKPTYAMVEARNLALSQKIRSKIVFASSWMGSAVPAMIQDAFNWSDIDSIELFIYYSMQDKAGASAADFMAENASNKFPIYQNGKSKYVRHFEGGEKHRFEFEKSDLSLHHFDAPDNYILHQIERVSNVSTKITYGDNKAALILTLMQKLYIFNILPLASRKKIFYANGQGDKTAFDIRVKTKAGNFMTISLVNKAGQANLTALSTALHIENLMAATAVKTGVFFGYQLHQKGTFTEALKQNSSITISKH